MSLVMYDIEGRIWACDGVRVLLYPGAATWMEALHAKQEGPPVIDGAEASGSDKQSPRSELGELKP